MDKIQKLLNQVAKIRKKNDEILDATDGRFNIFNICGVNHYEDTHSAIIAEFLNPIGSHGLNSKFLECFIKEFCKYNDVIKKEFDCENARVGTERPADNGRLDILIEDRKNHAIIIENKIYAGDQWEQLKRYDKFAEKKFGKGKYQIFYLTLLGDEASEQSGKGVEYTPVSYKTEIISWLNGCVLIAEGHPMVQETIKQYINHLKSLTNQDMDTKNKEEIIRIMSKSENIETVFAIGDNLTEMKNYIINKVFLPQLTSICKELHLENASKEYDRANVKNADFEIHNPSWHFFYIRFEFINKGLGSLVVGIVHREDVSKKNNKTFKTLKKRFSKCWSWPFNHFPTYPNWGKDAMEAIHNGKMAEIFKDEIKKILELTEDLEM